MKAELVILAFLAALTVGIGAGIMAFKPAREVPIVKADTTPYKVRPPGWHMP